MHTLPNDVIKVRDYLVRLPDEQLSYVAGKLFCESEELLRMWKAIELRKAGDDDLWVWAFLRAAADAYNIPDFHHMSKKKRERLAASVIEYSNGLIDVLENHGLDGHMLYANGRSFRGYYILEDFGESNQERIRNREDVELVKTTTLIKSIADRAYEIIMYSPVSGKAGKNARAVRFIRMIIDRNLAVYREALYDVVTYLVNALYGTAYDKSDVYNITKKGVGNLEQNS